MAVETRPMCASQPPYSTGRGQKGVCPTFFLVTLGPGTTVVRAPTASAAARGSAGGEKLRGENDLLHALGDQDGVVIEPVEVGCLDLLGDADQEVASGVGLDGVVEVPLVRADVGRDIRRVHVVAGLVVGDCAGLHGAVCALLERNA